MMYTTIQCFSALRQNLTFLHRTRHVGFGSLADIYTATDHVRFTPESGRLQCTSACPPWAISGLMRRNKQKDPARRVVTLPNQVSKPIIVESSPRFPFVPSDTGLSPLGGSYWLAWNMMPAADKYFLSARTSPTPVFDSGR